VQKGAVSNGVVKYIEESTGTIEAAGLLSGDASAA